MSQGALTKYGIGTADPVDIGIDVESWDFNGSKEHLEPVAMRGTRSHFADNVTEGPEIVRGGFETSPGKSRLQAFLTWAGFSHTDGVYSLTEGLTARYLESDRVADRQKISGAYVNSLGIRMSKGVLWRWAFDVVGQQETIPNSGSFPSLTVPAEPRFALHHAVVTLKGSARKVQDVTISINHAVESDTLNDIYASLIEPSDRIINVQVTLPYTTANKDLLKSGVTGNEATFVLTNGYDEIEIEMPRLQFPDGAVTVPGKSGLMLQLDGVARADAAANDELVITYTDSSPP